MATKLQTAPCGHHGVLSNSMPPLSPFLTARKPLGLGGI
ncbi:Hypothetical protein Minf_0252 [Methylacidiphilum infernorum V4]|uniref:Uncharacterized protein n=1 Tax=Methylacidiphilum infernorum (isolate V4) TaxID=481448 RepID=B3DY35_METI4|nr:Hypothetical protein Minf_0252 [Methylacidiphilum infernorum V4]